MKCYLLFFLISIQFFSAQSPTLQSEYEVIYKVKIHPDTLNQTNVLQEYSSLLIKDNTSLFKSTQKAKSDSIALAIGKKQWENPIDGKIVVDLRDVPKVNFKDEVYLDKGKQTIFKELLKTKFSFPLEDQLGWKIEDETKTIENYICKKATTKYKNRTYVAWFSSAVPIPDGPYIFKNLPGLILEVYDTSDFLRFTLVSLKKVEKPILIMKDVFSTDYNTYKKARKNFLDDPAGAVSNQTGMALSPQNMARINENARRYNNYFD